MVTLRMEARSSLYTRDLSAHTHEWGPESYNEEEDTYSHSCTECGQNETYEKM
jgi:DNA-repair protein complementing XP-A cells